jgi:hypothetical protein
MRRPQRKSAKIFFDVSILILGLRLKVYFLLQTVKIVFFYIRGYGVFSTA